MELELRFKYDKTFTFRICLVDRMELELRFKYDKTFTFKIRLVN